MVFIGAGIIALLLYLSGGAEYVLGQVFRPGLRPHNECKVGDQVCRQRLDQQVRQDNLNLHDPLSNYANLGICRFNDTRCLERLRADTQRRNGDVQHLECASNDAVCIQSLREYTEAVNRDASFRNRSVPADQLDVGTITQPRPRPNQRTVTAGDPLIINVPGRYEGRGEYRTYPKALKLCQSPPRWYDDLKSRWSALFAANGTSERQNLAAQVVAADAAASAPFAAPRFTAAWWLQLFRGRAPLVPPVDGATLAPPYTPPAPYGTRAPDGCWYAEPDPRLRGNHTLYVPTDVATGQATISILEGQLELNRQVEREVRTALRTELGRYPNDQEVRDALSQRPDRYRERISEYTVEQVFIQGSVPDTSRPGFTASLSPSPVSQVIITWSEALRLFAECKVTTAAKPGTRAVLWLTDDRRVETYERQKGALAEQVQAAQTRCGKPILLLQ